MASSEWSDAGICKPDCPSSGKQSDGLQGDRFSSGIWSGDSTSIVKSSSDADIDRNDLFRIKQWMTALFDSDAPFFVEIRFASLIVERELSSAQR